MRLRTAPLQIPDRPPYFAVELEGRGPHHFRLQMFLHADALRLAMSGMFARLPESAFQPGADVETILREQPPGRQQQVVALGAAVVGLCWHHPAVELETDPGAARTDPEAYGMAVLEELHEGCDGWDGYDLPADLTALVQGVVGPVTHYLLGQSRRREAVATLASPEVDAAVERFPVP